MLSWMSSPYMNPIINQKQLEPSLITHHTLPLLWVKMATPSVAGLTESPWWLFCSMEGKDSWSNLLQTLFVLYALNVDVIWASVCRKLTKFSSQTFMFAISKDMWSMSTLVHNAFPWQCTTMGDTDFTRDTVPRRITNAYKIQDGISHTSGIQCHALFWHW